MEDNCKSYNFNDRTITISKAKLTDKELNDTRLLYSINSNYNDVEDKGVSVTPNPILGGGCKFEVGFNKGNESAAADALAGELANRYITIKDIVKKRIDSQRATSKYEFIK